MSRRFEDLLDVRGRIRLRTKLTYRGEMTFLEAYRGFCRGWQFDNFESRRDGDTFLLTAWFRRDPQRQFIAFFNEDGTIIRTEKRYPDADFDAMLAALEPYELVPDAADEPLTVEAS